MVKIPDTCKKTGLPILRKNDLDRRFDMEPGFIYMVVGESSWGRGYSVREAWNEAGRPKLAKVFKAWAAVEMSSYGGWRVRPEYSPKLIEGMNHDEAADRLFKGVAIICILASLYDQVQNIRI